MTPGFGREFDLMGMEAIEFVKLEDLYNFVESAAVRTGLILDPDAVHRPWARAVSADCADVRWYFPSRPLPEQMLQHLSNFAHVPLTEKAFVLMERGQVLRGVEIDAVNGSSQPHRLAGIVKQAFEPRRRGAASDSSGPPQSKSAFMGDPYEVLGVSQSDSDREIKRRYKQLIMEYHPDRVAHLGQELRELASRKTTEINAAYAAIRRKRNS